MERDGPLDLTSVEALADSAPVRKLLNMVFLLAIKDHASDLHFEPFESEFKIRIRADGVLYEMVPPPRHLAVAITTRIKVMADLDIAERRLPQDGRIQLSVGGHPVDMRVSVLPTMFGESVVLRILDRSVVMLDLDVVGLDPTTLATFPPACPQAERHCPGHGADGLRKDDDALWRAERIERDHRQGDYDGGSGRITIWTVSSRSPLDEAIGNTFAQCLRSILRQDPDKILVGEIRDLETAEIAVQAALTGHMVFSTLHTNDAPSTVTRLRDMGVPPFLLTATLEAVLAQRLIRKICPSCREETMPPMEKLAELALRARRRHRQDHLSRRRLRKLQQHGLPRPHGAFRIDGDQRRDARSHQRRGVDAETPRLCPAKRHAAASRGRAGENSSVASRISTR